MPTDGGEDICLFLTTSALGAFVQALSLTSAAPIKTTNFNAFT
jgi:hypothetical protein